MASFTGEGVAFTYPKSWSYAFGRTTAPIVDYDVFLWLSTQPLHDPCVVNGNSTTCTSASDGLSRGGVLVRWEHVFPPIVRKPGPGRHVHIGGRPARLIVRRAAVVATIFVSRHDVVRMTATLRAPHLRENRGRVLRMLETLRFVSA